MPPYTASLEKAKYTLQYSGLENSMDCIVYGVTKSQTQLDDFHFHMIALAIIGPVSSHINFRISW